MMSDVRAELNRRIDARLQIDFESRLVRCPGCRYVFEWSEMADLITLHGEHGPQVRGCPGCDKQLVIEEEVTRTFAVTVKDDE